MIETDHSICLHYMPSKMAPHLSSNVRLKLFVDTEAVLGLFQTSVMECFQT